MLIEGAPFPRADSEADTGEFRLREGLWPEGCAGDAVEWIGLFRQCRQAEDLPLFPRAAVHFIKQAARKIIRGPARHD